MNIENFIKLRSKQKSERSAIENAIVFLWMETTGYDSVAFEAADELERLNTEREALRGFAEKILGRQSCGDTDIPLWVYQAAKASLNEG